MTADELQAKWTELTATFDRYYNQLPVSVQQSVNTAISDWQSFYYGNTGSWPTTSLAYWSVALSKTLQALTAAIPVGAQPDPVGAAKPSRKAGDTTFYIGGQGPLADLQIPKWVMWAVPIGIAALWVVGLDQPHFRRKR